MNPQRRFAPNGGLFKPESVAGLARIRRRSGKSYMASIIAVYLATFRDWRPYLSQGEKGWIFIIATDKDQAKIIKRYISGILNSNPAFRKTVVKELEWEIELENSVNIAVKTCNFRSLRGFTVLAAICEEIAFWRDENSANPAQDVLAALRLALATVPESMLDWGFYPLRPFWSALGAVQSPLWQGKRWFCADLESPYKNYESNC